MIDLCLVSLPNSVLTTPTMYFPLGTLYLGASVLKAGYTVQIVDMRAGVKELPEAKFYGFSCTTPEIKQAKELTKEVKGITIVGGAHPTLLPEDCMESFDYIVRGEGEEVLPQIIAGVWGRGVINAPRISDLSSISHPAWHLVDNPFSEELFPGERYGKGEKAMTVSCSRGCPYKCSFCGNMLRTPVLYRTVEDIISELDELKSLGVKHIRFEDDNFTIHPQFENLCLDLHNLDISWKCHTRSQLVKLSQMELMKWANCEEVGLGVESADDRVLEINNKMENCGQHIKAVEIIHQAGLRAKTYFIAGLPGETDETLEFNKQFFRQAKPEKWTLSTFTPYPGCEVYAHPDAFGIKITDTDFNHWWNFTEDHFVFEMTYEPQEVTWQRYKKLYAWLVSNEWK